MLFCIFSLHRFSLLRWEMIRMLPRALTCGRRRTRVQVRATGHEDGSPHPSLSAAEAPLCHKPCLSCVHTFSSLICTSLYFILRPLFPLSHRQAHDVFRQKLVIKTESIKILFHFCSPDESAHEGIKPHSNRASSFFLFTPRMKTIRPIGQGSIPVAGPKLTDSELCKLHQQYQAVKS